MLLSRGWGWISPGGKGGSSEVLLLFVCSSEENRLTTGMEGGSVWPWAT